LQTARHRFFPLRLGDVLGARLSPRRLPARRRRRAMSQRARQRWRRSPRAAGVKGLDRPAGGSIQNGSSRLLISQAFLPRSVPNRHLQDALRTKCFFRASVPNIALSHRRHGTPWTAPSLLIVARLERRANLRLTSRRAGAPVEPKSRLTITFASSARGSQRRAKRRATSSMSALPHFPDSDRTSP
jgi:hypothetical protein